MALDKEKDKKHLHNLMKTIEGTGWVLCDAVNYMMKKDIKPEKDNSNSDASPLAQNFAEIFEIIAECEEPEIIDHLADKMLEHAGKDKDKLISYLENFLGDNPLYEKIVENSKLH